MYEELTILALFIFLYSLIAGRIERSALSGPIIFVATGIMVGPMALGWLDGREIRDEMRLLADLTLALILFVDAANANLAVLNKQYKLPFRMLAFGLPGAIVLGFGAALLIFDALTIYEAAILAVMLAATDAALGKAVITDPSVPPSIREGLNVESGLNDGLCVPILFVFLALALDPDSKGFGTGAPLLLLLQEVGVGLVVGIGLAATGAWLLKYWSHKGSGTEVWMQVTVPGLAIGCFALTQELHGSGYVAAFAGGIVFGLLTGKSTHKYVFAAEGVGEMLAAITWLFFGVAIVTRLVSHITWEVAVYSLLSLTIVRMLPIYVALVGSGEPAHNRLFLGWFGPRGLASIVFAIIVFDSGLPGAELMVLVVVSTVFFSLIAHGVSAKPLVKWLVEKGAAGSD